MFRQGQHQRLQIVAPMGMWNASTAAQRLKPEKYWQDVQNMLPTQAGTLSKRFGTVRQAVYNADPNAVILDMAEYPKSDGSVEYWVYTDDGTHQRLLKYVEGATPPADFVQTILFSSAAADGMPFFLYFAGKLVFFNGQNTPMSYDGSAWTPIKSYAKEIGSSYTQTDTNTIVITNPQHLADGGYAIGNKIRATFATAGQIEATISNVSGTNPVTIDVSGTPFPNPNQTINSVFVQVPIPAFRYMCASYDRLWALGPGLYRPKKYVDSTDRMFVYFTDVLNTVDGWHNDTTGAIGFIDTSAKHGIADSLMAIGNFSGYMVFFGQHVTQVWAGDDPSDATAFAWQKNLPLGLIHPKLLQPFPNDLVFATRYGLRQLSLVFQNAEVESASDIGQAIDSAMDEQVTLLLDADEADYRLARSFYYPKGGFYGFRLSNVSYVFAIQEEQKGFARWTQNFATATSFFSSVADKLFLSVDNILLLYGDGAENTDITYAEDSENLYCQGVTPWIQISGRRFNGRYAQLMTTPRTAALDILLDRFINNDVAISKTSTFQTPVPASGWDVSFWDESFWDGSTRLPYVTDRYVAYSVCYRISNNSTEGPFEFVSLDIFGELER